MHEAILNWDVIERVLVVCATAGTITDGSFDPLLEEIRANRDIDACLATSLGAQKMTVIQRTDAAQLLRDRAFKTVVLTDSRATRGILTAISWFGGDISAKALDDMDGGLDALELRGSRRTAVRTLAARLRQQLQAATPQGQRSA